MTTRRRFPAGFLWGAATSAYQVEGAVSEDGRTDSTWDAFCRRPGAVRDGSDGSVATDHYHRYLEDVDLLDELALGAYRFSVAWPRVRPDGGPVNPAGLAFYDRLVDALLERGITPWPTVYHWDLPHALELRGGWTNRATAQRFTEYALSVHDALGDRVRHWTTLNEPWCSAFLGYGTGEHAPGLQDSDAALRAAHHLLLAHGQAAHALLERDPTLAVGITLNVSDVRPADPSSPADLDAHRRADAFTVRYFLDPLFRGHYPADVLEDLGLGWPADVVREGDLGVISTPIGMLGVNYYTGEAVTGPPLADVRGAASLARALGPTVRPGSEHVRTIARGLPRTAMGWEVWPEGLSSVLLRIQSEYTGPAGIGMYVTENGAAYDDEPDGGGYVRDDERIAYLSGHLRALHDAIARGADVRGYFVWSLLDNFEWAFGYERRFGLVRVVPGTLERVPKASAAWYARVARTGRLP